MSRTERTAEQAQLVLEQFEIADLEAAAGEAEREYQVRARCFDRWVAEGKLSKIDARDRLSRQLLLLEICNLLLDTRSTTAVQ